MVQNSNPQKIVETLISKFVLLYNIIKLALSDAYMNEHIKSVKPYKITVCFSSHNCQEQARIKIGQTYISW